MRPFTAVMRATAVYPPGEHELPAQGLGDGAHVLCVPESMEVYADPQCCPYAPSRGIQRYARHARWIDHSENFDGAVVLAPILQLVHEQHGGRNPIGWVRSSKTWASRQGPRVPCVYAFAGDILVAIIAPAVGSRAPRRRERLSFPPHDPLVALALIVAMCATDAHVTPTSGLMPRDPSQTQRRSSLTSGVEGGRARRGRP